MFNLQSGEVNTLLFNLKSRYESEQSFDYKLKVFNHITKRGFEIDIVDESEFVKDIEHTSTIVIGDKTTFNTGDTKYITAFSGGTFIFNNIIQISGINYEFYDDPDIEYVKSAVLKDYYYGEELGNYYYIVFNADSKGQIVVFDENNGVVINSTIFCNDPVSNLQIISMENSVIVGYYNTVDNKSYLIEIKDDLSLYTPVMFYEGISNYLKINKVNDTKFILTYQTSLQGIIQISKLSNDHIFSMGYPFVFNDDMVIFSDSVYQSDNVVIIFYDIFDQLKVKNCRIYDDYIGIGLPEIIKDSYCYDLNINKLDNNYVYCSYYDANTLSIENSLIKIDNDITIIHTEESIDDWNEGLYLTTINSLQYMISYMDFSYNGVYRLIDVEKSAQEPIDVDYNLFEIDLTDVITTDNIGHNDYWIYYDNQIIEKGVCYIEK